MRLDHLCNRKEASIYVAEKNIQRTFPQKNNVWNDFIRESHDYVTETLKVLFDTRSTLMLRKIEIDIVFVPCLSFSF